MFPDIQGSGNNMGKKVKKTLNKVTLGVSGMLIGDGEKHTSYTPYNEGEYERGYSLKSTGYINPNLNIGYGAYADDSKEALARGADVGKTYSAQKTEDEEYDEYINNIRQYWAGLANAEKAMEEQTGGFIDDRRAYNEYMEAELARNGTNTGEQWYRGQLKSTGENKGLLGGGVKTSGTFQGDQGYTTWRLDNEDATRDALRSIDDMYKYQTDGGSTTYQTKVDEYNKAVEAYNELQNQRRIHNADSKLKIQNAANSANTGSNVVLREDKEGLSQDATMLGKGNANDLRNVYSNIDEAAYEGGLDWTSHNDLGGLSSATRNENSASYNDKSFETTKEWSDERLKTVTAGLYKRWSKKDKARKAKLKEKENATS